MTSPVVINDVIPRTQSISSSSQTVFDTDWTADATTDIVVYRRASGDEPDDQTQEVNTNEYNVTFIGDSETVRVTFNSGQTTGDIITIIRATPASRTNLYTNTNFTTSMLNQDFGILTLVDQQAQLYDQESAPHYNLSATFTDEADKAIDMILPILPANYIWKKSSTNTHIEAVPIPGGSGGSGTVNPGLINQLAWYAEDGSAVSGLPTSNSKVLTTNGSGVPVWASMLSLGGQLIGMQVFTSTNTWTPTSGCTKALIFCTGGGGGGGGSGSGSAGAGAAGGTSSVGVLVSCTGGAGGPAWTGAGGSGGTATSATMNLVGSQGEGSALASSSGGAGGGSFWGPGAPAIYPSADGWTGQCYGAGGSGGGGTIDGSTTGPGPGAGGGGTGIRYATGITGTYSVTIGAGGVGGTAGPDGQAGGAGAAGVVMILEFS